MRLDRSIRVGLPPSSTDSSCPQPCPNKHFLYGGQAGVTSEPGWALQSHRPPLELASTAAQAPSPRRDGEPRVDSASVSFRCLLAVLARGAHSLPCRRDLHSRPGARGHRLQASWGSTAGMGTPLASAWRWPHSDAWEGAKDRCSLRTAGGLARQPAGHTVPGDMAVRAPPAMKPGEKVDPLPSLAQSSEARPESTLPASALPLTSPTTARQGLR